MTGYRVVVAVVWTAGLVWVLVCNGALPGIASPTTNQVFWMTGFAQSFANGNSIYATNFGLPEPAAISFGLSAALPMAALLKLGVPVVDVYAAAFACWLAIAMWGAYQLARWLGARPGVSILCAVIWLTFPVVWQHSIFSTVQLGCALLPTYLYTALRVIRDPEITPRSACLLALAAITAVFMDGYTFMMFAVGSGIVFAVTTLEDKLNGKRHLSRAAVLAACFGAAYVLYALYEGRVQFDRAGLDFFRGWGASIELFFIPPKGQLLIPDWIGISAPRSEAAYFGDGSVYLMTFSAGIILVGLFAAIQRNVSKPLRIIGLLIAVVGFYLSLGPSFKFLVYRPAGMGPLMPESFAPWPTGTAILSKYVPGFDNMRASYRWEALGMVGLWFLLVAWIASRRTQSFIAVFALLALLVLNIPTGAFVSGVANRNMVVAIDNYTMSLKGILPIEKNIAFVPYYNDFLVNYISGRLNLKTFDVGGDKNLEAAKEKWPNTLKAFKINEISPDFYDKVVALLDDPAVGAVVLPYINTRTASHVWPWKQEHRTQLVAIRDELGKAGRYKITDTQYFALIERK